MICMSNTSPGDQEPSGKGKAAKKALIMDVTKRMIEEKGYQDTNTNKIAQAAGISIGLVYKYFPRGKIDILREMGQIEVDRVRGFFRDNPLDLNAGTLTSVISGFIGLMLAQHKANQRISAAFDIALLSSDPDARTLNLEMHNADPSEIVPMDAMKSLNADISSERLNMLWKLIHGTIHWHVNIEPLVQGDVEFVKLVTDISMALLRPSRPS